jgi:hypothetical protein
MYINIIIIVYRISSIIRAVYTNRLLIERETKMKINYNTNIETHNTKYNKKKEKKKIEKEKEKS